MLRALSWSFCHQVEPGLSFQPCYECQRFKAVYWFTCEQRAWSPASWAGGSKNLLLSSFSFFIYCFDASGDCIHLWSSVFCSRINSSLSHNQEAVVILSGILAVVVVLLDHRTPWEFPVVSVAKETSSSSQMQTGFAWLSESSAICEAGAVLCLHDTFWFLFTVHAGSRCSRSVVLWISVISECWEHRNQELIRKESTISHLLFISSFPSQQLGRRNTEAGFSSSS